MAFYKKKHLRLKMESLKKQIGQNIFEKMTETSHRGKRYVVRVGKNP